MLKLVQTGIPGVSMIERTRLYDERGYFERVFCTELLRNSGWPYPIAQINHTFTAQRGAVRGMHFQHPPHAEAKIVTCLKGRVHDVAVDLRRGSPTFLQSLAVELSGEMPRSLLIGKGFAHGFQTLTEDTELLYFHSTPYAVAASDGINPIDPCIAIAWPLQITAMSENDRKRAMLAEDFEGLIV